MAVSTGYPDDEDDPKDRNQSVHDAKRHIGDLVNEIGLLRRRHPRLEPEEYYREFMARVLTALAAAGGAVWIKDPNDTELDLAYQVNLNQSFDVDTSKEELDGHTRLLDHVVQTGSGRLQPPRSTLESTPCGTAGNPTDYLLVLAPVRIDDKAIGVLEVLQRNSGPPASQRGYLRFLNQMAEHVADYVRGDQ